MTDAEKKQVVEYIQKLILKTQEVSTMLHDGKVIVAYQKLGGVIKNLGYLGTMIQKGESVLPQPDQQ